MSDYTVIVDDSNAQIVYGPAGDSWSPFNSSDAYQGTLHHAVTRDTNLTFSFVGGREVFIRGNFIGDNNDADSATYPVFQVDSYNVDCNPKPPQDNSQFLCNTQLPSTITNHTLTMFMNPNATVQQFYIDYIRYGTSSQVAQNLENGMAVYVKSPDNTTLGLSFKGDWQYQSIGGTNDIDKAMHTSTHSSKAFYPFRGDYFAWWGCCMPAGTPSNAANATYSIDGGEAVSFQINQDFLQSAQCKDEKVLFHTQAHQLQAGNHVVEVVYSGDDTTMPLTLCALAAAPLDFRILDMQPPISNLQTPPSSTLSPSITPSRPPSAGGNDDGNGPHHKSHIGIIVGITSGVAIIILVCIGIIWRRMKGQAEQWGQRSRFSATSFLSAFAFHPVVGFVDLEKRQSTLWGSSPASAAPPSDIPTVPPMTNGQDASRRSHSTDTFSDIISLQDSRPPSYRSTRTILLDS